MLSPFTLEQASCLRADLLADTNWGLYFHGTASTFEAFDERHIGAGSDANSGLGHFVTNNPESAADYAQMVAGSKGVVLVVLLRESYPFEFDTFESFYGADWPDTGEPVEDRQHFLRLRQALIQQGHDSAFFTLDDDGLIGIALQDQHIVVLGALSQEDARTLGQTVPEDALLHSTSAESKTCLLEHIGLVLTQRQPALA